MKPVTIWQCSMLSSRGHMNVCALCGCSLRNRKRDRIVRENPSLLQQAIHTELQNRIAPRQVIMYIFNNLNLFMPRF